MMPFNRILALLVIYSAFLALAARKPNKKQESAPVKTESIEPPNAFDQNLPDCKKGFPRLQKKTKAKAIVCPMFRYVTAYM